MSQLSDLYDRLAAYKLAEIKILEGNQSYTIQGVVYERPPLAQVQAEIRRIAAEIALLENNGSYGSQQVIFGGRR
jgi:hypothetical protein